MRTNKFVRIFAALLAMVMMLGVVSMFASCNDDETEETESESTSTNTDVNKNSYEKLEKKLYNKDLKMATLSSSVTDFLPDEANKGETLTDGLIARGHRLNSDFGVNLIVEEVTDYGALIDLMGKQQSGTLDDYDVYVGQLYNFKGNALQNHCMDLNNVDYIDLDGEWWDAACRDTLVMDGKNFMMTGDISPESMLISACLVFNKNLMQDLKKDEPYDLVEDKKWTLDELYNYITGVTNESALDGQGRFGLTAWALDVPYSLFYGANETFVKFDSDTNEPVVSYDEKKVVNIYDKIYDIIITANSNYLTMNDIDKTDAEPDRPAYEVFADGRALFADVTLSKISKYITSMKDDYGVVPMPLYDTNQEDYMTFVNGAAPLFFIATTEKDPSFVGHMLEAMATYNYEYITPDMYEVVAKSKDARDPQSAEMIDIILRSRIYDFAYYGQLSLSSVVSNSLLSRKESVASQFTTAKKSSETGLKLMIKEWNKIMSQQKK